MLERRVFKNLIFNIVLQIATFVIPLATVPYVSRILGEEGIGSASYSLSIVQYFILLGALGLNLYGNRQIAYTRDDKEEMSKAFWSMWGMRIITMTFATFCYGLFITLSPITRKNLFWIQGMQLVAAMVDITWLFMGREDFKKTVTLNLGVKLIGVLLTYLLVKQSTDLPAYVAITALTVLIANVALLCFLPKTVVWVRVGVRDMFTHFVPALFFLIPTIATTVYVTVNKTILGSLTDMAQVGYYEQADKIVKAALAIITALGTVMFPFMSNAFAKGEMQKMREALSTCIMAVCLFAFPMSFGVAGLAREFVPWFFGDAFLPAIVPIILLAPLLVVIGLSNVVGIQYLLPTNQTQVFTRSVVLGAVISVIFNAILIPPLAVVGACIAALIAELTVTGYQLHAVWGLLPKRKIAGALFRYGIASTLMFLLVRSIGSALESSALTTVIQAVVGGGVYFILLLLFRDSLLLSAGKKLNEHIKKFLSKRC